MHETHTYQPNPWVSTLLNLMTTTLLNLIMTTLLNLIMITLLSLIMTTLLNLIMTTLNLITTTLLNLITTMLQPNHWFQKKLFTHHFFVWIITHTNLDKLFMVHVT